MGGVITRVIMKIADLSPTAVIHLNSTRVNSIQCALLNTTTFVVRRKNCQAGFLRRSLLKDHENIHDNVQRKCIFCPYTCVRSQTLSMHQRAHFNIRNYKCEVCEMEFLNTAHLNNHFDRKHSGNKVNCPLCDFQAPRFTVQVHLVNKHGIMGSHWSTEQQKFILPEFKNT